MNGLALLTIAVFPFFSNLQGRNKKEQNSPRRGVEAPRRTNSWKHQQQHPRLDENKHIRTKSSGGTDGTSMSGVTDPSFFHLAKQQPSNLPKHQPRMQQPMRLAPLPPSSAVSSTATDPFDVNSPVFQSGDPFASPKLTPVPVLSDDFSDPFFPGADSLSDAPDPGLELDDSDHEEKKLDVPTQIISPNKKRSSKVDWSTANRAVSAIDKVLDSPSAAVSKRRVGSPIPRVADNVNTFSALSELKKRYDTKPSSSRAQSIRASLKATTSLDSNSKQSFSDTSSHSSGNMPLYARPQRKRQIAAKVMEQKHHQQQSKESSPVVKSSGSKFAERQRMFSKAAAREDSSKGGVYGRYAGSSKVVSSYGQRNTGMYGQPSKATSYGKQKKAAPVVETKQYQFVDRSVTGPKLMAVREYMTDPLDSPQSTKQSSLGELSTDVSVSSDVDRLRSILRRSRSNRDTASNARYIEPLESAFAVYDEKKITDPMQRAGLRLLSAAVVPIQAAARRYLCLREALTRMWAIVVIQAMTRRWLATSRYKQQRSAATKIQSIQRGGMVRDQLMLEHCCAIEIQRHVRGLIASLFVYEQIYKITVAQACVRRKLALDKAMDRMVAIIQIQSVFRGHLVRIRKEQWTRSATQVQTAWRSFSGRFNYQLDLLDIIIVQSIFRRKAAVKVYNEKSQERNERCATLIQSHWRSYDCTMNYLHFLADVLIAQSVARRWMAKRRCATIRHNSALALQTKVRAFLAKKKVHRIVSAITIQRVWRGFVCYADYMFSVSDIVLVQSVARRWIKRRKYPGLVHERRASAATTIQKHWRGFTSATDYMFLVSDIVLVQSIARRWIKRTAYKDTLREHKTRAATAIQAQWRGYAQLHKYYFDISDIVVVQSIARRWIKVRVYPDVLLEHRTNAATKIQTRWRGHAQVHKFQVMLGEYDAATLIQAYWRRFAGFTRFLIMLNGTMRLQSVCRGMMVRESVAREHYHANVMQCAFRSFSARDEAETLRDVKSLVMGGQTLSVRESKFAIRIQKMIRGSQVRDAVAIHLCARSIQTAWRRYAAREALVYYLSARRVQTAWRRYSCRSVYVEDCAARKVQSIWRGFVIRVTVKLYMSARRIQKVYRGYSVREPYVQYISARKVQRWWRLQKQLRDTEQMGAASRIQTFWRCKSLSAAYRNYIAARRIQTFWRCKSLFCAYTQFISARNIQTAWRAKSARTPYREFINARRIQACWRRWSMSNAYQAFIAARKIQTFWRGRSMALNYRAYTTEKHDNHLSFRSACRIQTAWRCKSQQSAYKQFSAARHIQYAWRCKILHSSVKHASSLENYSALRIQTFWRSKNLSAAYQKYLIVTNAVVHIQCLARRRNACKLVNNVRLFGSVKQGSSLVNRSATTIQSFWRCKHLHAAYKKYLLATRSVIYIQCLARRRKAIKRASKKRLKRLRREGQAESHAAISIQKVSRGFMSRQICENVNLSATEASRYSKKERSATATIQRVSRGYLSRQASEERFLTEEARYSREHCAATCIATAWRGFNARQNYWHILGSIIQIQAVVRGWIAQERLQVLRDRAVKLIESANAINRFVNRYVARQRGDDLQHDKAARKIQGFFLMVKAEVDREIRAEKRRRKARRKQKRKQAEKDEKVLETIWRKSINQEQTQAVASSLAAANRPKSLAPPRSNGQVDGSIHHSLSEDSLRKHAQSFDQARGGSGGILSMMQMANSSLSMQNNDKLSDASGYSRASSSFRRHLRIPSRCAGSKADLSKSEIEDDFQLEEAWIDAGIQDAKLRRRAEKRGSKRSGSRRSQRPPIRQPDRPPRSQEV